MRAEALKNTTGWWSSVGIEFMATLRAIDTKPLRLFQFATWERIFSGISVLSCLDIKLALVFEESLGESLNGD